MKPRLAQKTVHALARQYPVVVVTGPRQSGKTTLARHSFLHKPYALLEEPHTREFAERDPAGFLDRYPQGAVLDEVQRAPALLSYIQGIVDNKPVPGQFILTGSQQFGLLSGVSQSLAGRAALVNLLPFSLAECYSTEQLHRTRLDDILFAGLYPPVHDRPFDPSPWYANYVQTYVERDVRQMVNVRDLRDFHRFVRLCAGRIGQLLNLSSLASDCGITHNTAKAWISVLEASYVLFLLAPYHASFNKRVVKTPKLYFWDTGVATWLLGVQASSQLDMHSLRGELFENLVIVEMMKDRYNHGMPGNLYFWRDRAGAEVDVVVDHGTHLVPVEVKSGKTLPSDAFRGLEYWMTLAGTTAAQPAVVYGGNESMKQCGIHVYSWRDPAFPAKLFDASPSP